jgi:hypothetical protein
MPHSRLSSAARWSALSIGAAFAAIAAGAWVNYRVDLYGVFGPNDGAARVVYTNERTSKYLLSMRYVPERFDALLVGTSITNNWDTAKIGALRVYNGSLNGGNISEGKLIADNALAGGTLRAMLFCVYPYITETHGRKAGGMDARDFLGALGSPQLLRDYSVALLISGGFSRPKWNEYGVYDPGAESIKRQHTNRGWWEDGGVFTAPDRVAIDPVAFSEYAELVARARFEGVTVIEVTPPIFYSRWRLAQSDFDGYYSRMATLFRKDDPSIDFNKPEFEGFRKRRENFSDGYHLSKTGADFIMSAVDGALWRCCGRKLSAQSNSVKDPR